MFLVESVFRIPTSNEKRSCESKGGGKGKCGRLLLAGAIIIISCVQEFEIRVAREASLLLHAATTSAAFVVVVVAVGWSCFFFADVAICAPLKH